MMTNFINTVLYSICFFSVAVNLSFGFTEIQICNAEGNSNEKDEVPTLTYKMSANSCQDAFDQEECFKVSAEVMSRLAKIIADHNDNYERMYQELREYQENTMKKLDADNLSVIETVKAHLLLLMGKKKLAIQKLEECIEANPTFYPADFMLGYILLEEEPSRANEIFMGIIGKTRNPGAKQYAYYSRSLGALVSGEYERAERYAKKVQELEKQFGTDQVTPNMSEPLLGTIEVLRDYTPSPRVVLILKPNKNYLYKLYKAINSEKFAISISCSLATVGTKNKSPRDYLGLGNYLPSVKDSWSSPPPRIGLDWDNEECDDD